MLDPHLEGPGLAMELYPEELRFDSEALWSARPPMENGLRYIIPPEETLRCEEFLVAGEADSASDSVSLMLQVMVIMGGMQGRSREVGLSKSLIGRRGCLSSKVQSGWENLRCGGGEPGIKMEGAWVGDGVWMVRVGMTSGVGV